MNSEVHAFLSFREEHPTARRPRELLPKDRIEDHHQRLAYQRMRRVLLWWRQDHTRQIGRKNNFLLVSLPIFFSPRENRTEAAFERKRPAGPSLRARCFASGCLNPP